MKAKYFKMQEEIDSKIIEEVAQGIKEGKSVIFPTETVYGIGANAFDEVACKKVFKIKERPSGKPLIVLISNFEMLKDISILPNKVEQKLMEQFWPGPLTIILETAENSKIPKVVCADRNDIGIRMTSGKIAHALIEKANVPIVAPSANLSGKPTGVKIKNIIKELGDRVDYILDVGDIESSLTSTVVKVKDNVIYVLRQGVITIEELKKIANVEIL